MTERQISDGLCAYLRKEGLSFVRARTDKKSGIQEGWPDVTVCHCSRVWLCELKTPTGKLSAKQVECHAKLKKNGTPVTIARSVEESVNAVKAFFGILTPGEQKNEPQGATERQKEQPVGIGDVLSGKTKAFRKPEPSTQNPAEGQKETSSEPAPQDLFIADFGNCPCVFRQGWGKNAILLRTATQYDLLNIPRR